MTYDEFFNVATEGTIRTAVARLMTHDKYLSKLSGEAYYEVEDAICHMIEGESFPMWEFIRRQSIKQDFEIYLDQYFSEELADEVLEKMVDEFTELISNDDSVNDMRSYYLDLVCSSMAKRLEAEEYSALTEGFEED